MSSEIQTLAEIHRLPPEVARDFEALVSRLVGGGSAATIALDSASPPHSAPAPAPSSPPRPTSDGIPERYEDLGRIGVGGMGEVRRVRDRELGRTCAYKAIRADLRQQPNVLARFVEEAQIGAQLQHPNIPPVYDAGLLTDGRPWFTMKEVRGRTFRELIREAHAREVDETALRRLCDVLAKVCDAVGYAHTRGVVHRDLKPDNVMTGPHGEVFVLDWGLAKVVGRVDYAHGSWDSEPEVATERSADETMKTRVGRVLGTAAYMSPEQARGEVDRLDARSDTYALGAMLYELLTGRPPFEGGDARAVLRQVLAGPPAAPGRARTDAARAANLDQALDEAAGRPLPEELVALCMRCLSREPGARPADGEAVAAELRAWLDGSGKRAKALEVVAEAGALVTEAATLRARAAELRAEGAALLARRETWAPEEQKAPGWAKQDEAVALERDAVLVELKRDALLRGALTHAPDLAEAHAGLVELELGRHRAAESARDHGGAARAERRVMEHLASLSERHPTRVAAATYLKGDGALTITTDAPDVEVLLVRFERRNRRLVEVPLGSLGRTPLIEVPLPMGSYVCVLRHPERADVRYPVHIGRREHWDGAPPGANEPVPVRLPRHGELGPDDCLVPAGWFWAGGDPSAFDCLSRRRLWCDELVVKRFPVTNRAYLAFLDDLVARGRGAEAARYQPREREAGEGAPVFGRDEEGRFVLRPDADGDVWDLDWPVVLVDWFGATAYAAWMAERTGLPWRLLGELEWEKAARGVDGRFYPWGDVCEPPWCAIRASHPGRPLPQRVDSFPVDTSVYGVRGLGGNVADWCADAYLRDALPDHGERVAAPSLSLGSDPSSAARCHRGGDWDATTRGARSAVRYRNEPGSRTESVGFRLAFRPSTG